MLPDKGKEWPPKPFDQSQRDMRTWNAWHVGDVDALTAIYEAENRPRASTAGGLKGFFERFFWGRSNQQQSRRLHVPAAADVARTIADLVFSQRPMFVVGEDDARGDRTKTQERLQKVCGEDDVARTLLDSAEVGSVLGGSYLRWWWDKDIADKVRLGTVAADAAVPTFRYDTLVGVTFWKVVADDDGKTVYRHLERHEPGRILHGLYLGDKGRLGRKVPLAEHPSTAWAGKLVNSEGAILTGVKKMTACYVPNAPARKWRNTPGLSELGRSDFEGLEPVLDALDETWSAWMRDIELGKARLFVAEDMLKSNGAGGGLLWDSEQSIFTAMAPGMGSAASGGAPVQANQFAIRYMEYAHTVAELLNTILRGVGLSSSSFTDSTLAVGVPAQTATEVNSKDRLSERTRDRRILTYRSQLRPFSATGFELDAKLFGTRLALKDMPEVRFPVRSQQSPVEMANTISTLHTAGVLSLEQSVRQQHPNWSSDDVNDEIERIKKDEQRKAQLGLQQQGPDPDEENYQF